MTAIPATVKVGDDGFARFVRLAGIYAAIALGCLLVQLFPIPGVFVMPLRSFFWIGAVIHVFMIHVAVLALRRKIPRLFSLIPFLFYGTGIVGGLYGDAMVAKWSAAQRWHGVARQVPAGVRYVAVDPWALVGGEARDKSSVFEPGAVGFELAVIDIGASVDRPGHNARLIPQARTARHCRRGTLKLGAVCLKGEPMARPDAFLVVRDAKEPSRAVAMPWGTVHHGALSIVLNDGGREETVGELRRASIVNTFSYFLYPTFGCGLDAGGTTWACGGLVWWPFRSFHLGFNTDARAPAPDSLGVLMAALVELRGSR
jgi:hypothetical protein